MFWSLKLYGDSVIARPGATALELMSVPIIPVWARVSKFDIRISYFRLVRVRVLMGISSVRYQVSGS